MCMLTSALRGQKRVSDALEMEIQVVASYLTWVLGTKLQQVLFTVEPPLQPVKRDAFRTHFFTLFVHVPKCEYVYPQ